LGMEVPDMAVGHGAWFRSSVGRLTPQTMSVAKGVLLSRCANSTNRFRARREITS
jgi:hypothetical protein